MNFQVIHAEWKMQIPRSYIIYYLIYIAFLNDKIIEIDNRWMVDK